MNPKDYTIDDWRIMSKANHEAYEMEKRDHEATKHRLEMWTDQANAHERVLLKLLFDVAKALASWGVTDDYLWKQAHRRFNELVDAELEKIWSEKEDSND